MNRRRVALVALVACLVAGAGHYATSCSYGAHHGLVLAVAREEVGVGSTGDDVPLLHEQHTVGERDRRDPVRDDERRHVELVSQTVQDPRFHRCVDR